jgi:hypothetical protein
LNSNEKHVEMAKPFFWSCSPTYAHLLTCSCSCSHIHQIAIPSRSLILFITWVTSFLAKYDIWCSTDYTPSSKVEVLGIEIANGWAFHFSWTLCSIFTTLLLNFPSLLEPFRIFIIVNPIVMWWHSLHNVLSTTTRCHCT